MLQYAVRVPGGAVHDGAGIDWLGDCAWAVCNCQGRGLGEVNVSFVAFSPLKGRDRNELTSVTV